ncbi:glycosyltransferase family 4 protein [Methanobacterium formicicum]|uniref:glycosyltransferase family 4 protein n=1 Tax=Methanobacterium formicicum TaxID=2162 RepID=UPI002491E022|nr:glycosyltransferase family 4 protein [Methanobacterium formicicum]
MSRSVKTSKKVKVAIITNIPTFYRQKQWEYYSNCEYFDLTIYYCANIEPGRHWKIKPSKGVKEVFLKGLSYKSFHFNPGILKIIFQDYDVFFVGGFGYPSLIILIVLLKLFKKKWVLIIDGISPLKIEEKNLISNVIKKYLIRGANAYFANGTLGANYLENYGIPLDKIFNQYMTVDVDYFKDKGKNSVEFRSKIRTKYGITEKTTVLMYAGRLIKHKGVHDLIRVVKHLNNNGHDIKLLVVGDGDFKKELKKQAQISTSVIFVGHVSPEEIYNYYYASDIFVLPTYDDPWGLVVNEAMACQLPIIVSNAAGCSIDLIEKNGYVITAGNLNELYSAIIDLINKNQNNNYGKKSFELIRNWTYRDSCKSFLKTLIYCLSNE